MKSLFSRRFTSLVVCLSLLLTPKPAKASIPTSGQVAGIAVGLVAAGAAIGIGVYLLVRKPPSITGCTASGPDGLTLHNDSDSTDYLLTGNTASIQSGDRVRLSGKKQSASGGHTFRVEKISKDYGACPASTTR